MKKNILLSFSTLLLLLSIVLSCTDHFPPEPLPNHQRIKKITQTLPDEPGITHVTDFFYKPTGDSLSSLKSYQMPDPKAGLPATTTYSYRADGVIVNKVFDNIPYPGELYVLKNYLSGQVGQLNYYDSQSDNYTMYFTYNGNQLESTRRTFKTSGVSFEQKIWYFFNNNNLDSANYETSIERNTTTVSKSKSEFTYDDKVNPFYEMRIIPAPNDAASPTTGNFNHYTFAGGLQSFMHLSRNNVLSEKSSTLSETTYSYEYNADGLPTKRITMKKNTPQDQPYVAETIIIEYETY